MRLSEKYRKDIKETLQKYFGKQGKYLLFGSRVDDTKRGGDIDLYIETDIDAMEAVELKNKVHTELMNKLGEQKIDILVYAKGQELLPIHEVAKMTGVEI